METQIIRAAELAKKLNIGKSTVYFWLKVGRLPRPIKFGGGCVGWRVADIEAWVNEKAKASA